MSATAASAVGAAAILAETRDLTRFDSARAVVEDAGLCPRRTPRAPTPVLAARHALLTTREDNKVTDAQARVAIAGPCCASCAAQNLPT